MSFGHALANVLRETCAQRVLEFAAFELRAQFIHRRDSKLLICAKDALRIEPGIVAQPRKFRRCLGSQCFESAQGSRADDLLHGVADGFPNPGVDGEVRLLKDEVFHAFRQCPNFRSGSLIGLDFIGILLLSGE